MMGGLSQDVYSQVLAEKEHISLSDIFSPAWNCSFIMVVSTHTGNKPPFYYD